MSPRRKSTAKEPAVHRLNGTVDHLVQKIDLLTDILDGVRETLEWITQNGLPRHEPALGPPLLRAMAADATAGDWSDHLEVISGIPAIVEQRTEAAKDPQIAQLQRLITRLVDSPELACSALSEDTQTIIDEVRQLLDLAVPDSQGNGLEIDSCFGTHDVQQKQDSLF